MRSNPIDQQSANMMKNRLFALLGTSMTSEAIAVKIGLPFTQKAQDVHLTLAEPGEYARCDQAKQ